MKVTSYEISRKLFKVGFREKAVFFWFNKTHCASNHEKLIGGSVSETEGAYGAYDLETLLKVLPTHISTKRGLAIFVMRKNSIFYEIERQNEFQEVVFGELKNELSWADTAALLILRLLEKKIINFKS